MSFYFRMRFSWYITSRCQFHQVFCFFCPQSLTLVSDCLAPYEIPLLSCKCPALALKQNHRPGIISLGNLEWGVVSHAIPWKLAVNHSAASRIPIQRLTFVSWPVFRLCPSHSQSRRLIHGCRQEQCCLVLRLEQVTNVTVNLVKMSRRSLNPEQLQFLTWNGSKHPTDFLTYSS
jgi:hypothetical protein